MQEELMLKIDNVSKRYKLGQIGGTTLRDELQRKRAKRKGLEDPTAKIGKKKVNIGEEFYALSNVSFEVKKGERVGIIGHNGAGKSTLLKLISRVTAPTDGTISMNGRVASMLEVGTGFHGELTGRENIYMNGAILGMSEKEIDSKIEDIIEFSECRDFIDTPVKRYSSGMYVKLAFSVAAHLDSEIMIMDEVLAVGDMAFQNKCLDKMNDVSREDGRTILYVSHNMNTIRQLCDRVIVLDHGQVIFDGDVEEGISIYLNVNDLVISNFYNLENLSREKGITGDVFINSVRIDNDIPIKLEEKLILTINFKVINENIDKVFFRTKIGQSKGLIGVSMSNPMQVKDIKDGIMSFELDTSNLAPGEYTFGMEIFSMEANGQTMHENVNGMKFIVTDDIRKTHMFSWYKPWGPIHFSDMKVLNNE